jgi:dTDP-4-amino-4,6-dideoxyglucose formyltransferase
MAYKAILVVSDNEAIIKKFIEQLEADDRLVSGRSFTFCCHPANGALRGEIIDSYKIQPINMKIETDKIINDYDLVISAHCKQIFPDKLVNSRKCINIHPGYNPFNRGWYPQVFSILNGKPLGATIHEIDEKLDHGMIIDRAQVKVEASDTSLSAYLKVQALEFELIENNLANILDGTYSTFAPEEEGNLNLKQDFNELQEINLDEKVTFQEAIDRFRALSHPPYKNLYFINESTGKKVWINLNLEEE